MSKAKKTKSADAPRLNEIEQEVLGRILRAKGGLTTNDRFALIGMAYTIGAHIADLKYGRGTKAAAANRELLVKKLYPQLNAPVAATEPKPLRCGKCYNLLRPAGKPFHAAGDSNELIDLKCRSRKCDYTWRAHSSVWEKEKQRRARKAV